MVLTVHFYAGWYTESYKRGRALYSDLIFLHFTVSKNHIKFCFLGTVAGKQSIGV